MPKNITPESGYNIKDRLDKIRANPSAYLSYMKSRIIDNPYDQSGDISAQSNFVATEKVASEIIERINSDTCCSSKQLSIIQKEIFSLIEIRSKVLEISKPTQDNGDNDNLKAFWLQYKLQLSTLSREINTYRLACYNCLNTQCKKRNPKYHIADIERRAHKIIMPSSHNK